MRSRAPPSPTSSKRYIIDWPTREPISSHLLFGDRPLSGSGEITQLLNRMREGDANARDELVRLVYGELRRMAGAQLRHEKQNHTLQSTALVHETYVRLLGKQDQDWQNRAHFFGAAAHAMRHILVDHARAAHAQRRGGGAVPVEMTDIIAAVDGRTEEILAVDLALEKLARVSPRQGTIVEMRFFAGFTEEEIAEALHLSTRTVKREWMAARAFLFREMNSKAATQTA